MAAEREAGISFAGICTLRDATICFAYLPANEDEAARMMVPQKGVKLSVPIHQREAEFVSNRFVWWFLKRRGRDFLNNMYG